jgi:hypothetical protein
MRQKYAHTQLRTDLAMTSPAHSRRGHNLSDTSWTNYCAAVKQTRRVEKHATDEATLIMHAFAFCIISQMISLLH